MLLGYCVEAILRNEHSELSQRVFQKIGVTRDLLNGLPSIRDFDVQFTAPALGLSSAEESTKSSIHKFIHKIIQIYLIEQLMNYTLPRTRPPSVIADFGELLVAILHGYGELDQCIYCCEKIIPTLLQFGLTSRLIFFFEFMGRSFHSRLENQSALKYFYKMLLAALNVGDDSKELHAYQHIAEEYYALGDITKSRFFNQKVAKGFYEPEESTARQNFTQLADSIHQISNSLKWKLAERLLFLYEERGKSLKREPSPPLSYYEDIPIEGGNRLLKMDEKRKEFLGKDMDFIRRNLPKQKKVMAQKFDQIIIGINDVLPKSGFGGKGNNIGEVTHYRSPSEIELLRRSEIKTDTLQPDNNTVSFVLTHRSTNRFIGSFHRHHPQASDQAGFVFKHYQTYLTEHGLLEIIKKFNLCGLSLEKMQKQIMEFNQYLVEQNKPEFTSEDTAQGAYGLFLGVSQTAKSLEFPGASVNYAHT